MMSQPSPLKKWSYTLCRCCKVVLCDMLDLPLGPSMPVSFFGGPFRTVVVSLTMLRLVAAVFFLLQRNWPPGFVHLQGVTLKKTSQPKATNFFRLPTFSPSILAPNSFWKGHSSHGFSVPKKSPFQGSHAPSFLVGRLRQLGQLVRQHDWRLGRWGGATEIAGISSEPNTCIVGFKMLIFRGVLYKICCSVKKHASMVIWRANCNGDVRSLMAWKSVFTMPSKRTWQHFTSSLGQPFLQSAPPLGRRGRGFPMARCQLVAPWMHEWCRWRRQYFNRWWLLLRPSIHRVDACYVIQHFSSKVSGKEWSVVLRLYQLYELHELWHFLHWLFENHTPKTSWWNVFSKSTG